MVEIEDDAQGSDLWKRTRCGQASASKMGAIMAKGRDGKPSATRANIMADIIAERLTGVPIEGYQSADMKWGIENEPKARDLYAFMTNTEPTLAKYVPHPTIPFSGASPDGYVGDDGLIEIKCPKISGHLSTLLGGSIDGGYILQMQWQLACTGRQWCDFVSFSPLLPVHMQLFKKRIYRDPVKIVEMQREVIQFLSEVDAKLAELKARFPFPEQAQAAE